ncbi:MAG: peptide deformylase, partial [Proteobacteria bacterium]|nr:peptide deformylase [Pseudomonadota bacterium]
MSLLSIVEIPDPRLRLVCEPVEAVDDEVRTLVADMFETMYAAHGIGLAASQVGVIRRVMVVDLQERETEEEDARPEAKRDPRVFINPEILWVSDEKSTYNEGCLSIPEQYAEVERPARCRVKWLDEQGKVHEEDFHGRMATGVQHEIDHLNGVLFID